MSGKTTNLEWAHANINPELRSEILSLKTKEDRTIFFDFMQFEVGKIRGLTPKFNLYTVPGQDMYALSRQIILSGVDGIIYVADSSPDRMRDNLFTLIDLIKNLRAARHQGAVEKWSLGSIFGARALGERAKQQGQTFYYPLRRITQ
jgi:signal recognition particle receptor subunit beta